MAEGTLRILAVDDEEGVRIMLERRLTRDGYECATAANAALAAELLEREEFALLLLDVMMPGKSGMDFLQEVVAQYQDMAVLMMTAVVDTATAVKAMRAGAFDYIVKPVNLDELSTRIERALDRRALILQNRQYQQDLEQMVAERTKSLEQRVREVTALNKDFQTYMEQHKAAQDGFRRLQEAITDFKAQTEELAGQALLTNSDEA